MESRSKRIRTQPMARCLTAFLCCTAATLVHATVYEFTKTDHSFSFEVRRAVPGSDHFVKLSTGEHHHLAIDDQGHVWSWGLNGSGQLGVGGVANSAVPIQVPGLEDIVQVAAGGAHSLALSASGVVYAWGNNGHGQLGVASPSKRTTPMPVTTDVGLLNGVRQIAAGESSSHFVRDDGSLWACGYNHPRITLPLEAVENVWVPTRVTTVENVRSMGVGRGFAAALHWDGSVTRWSNQFWRDPTPPPFMDFIVGSTQVFGIGLDRRVYAWGAAENGAIGLGIWKESVAAPMRISGLEGVTQVVSAGANTAAIDGSGRLYGWGGAPLFGNYGNQWPRRRPTLVMGIKNVETVSMGRLLALAIGTPTQVPAELTFSPATITSLEQSAGTVRLAKPAGPEGARLQLKIGTPPYVRDLETVTIAPGSSEASFTYRPKHFAGEPRSVFVGAGVEETFVGNFLRVVGCIPQRVEIVPSVVVGGESARAVVTSNLPAPMGGAFFWLDPVDLNDFDYLKFAVGGTILEGRTQSGAIMQTEVVSEPHQVQFWASPNRDAVATLTILPPPPIRLRFRPVTAMASSTVQAELEIQGNAPAGGLEYEVSAAHPLVSVPARITVPEGQSRAGFEVQVGAVRGVASVPIVASGAGGTITSNLVVNPPSVKDAILSPSPVPGGTFATLAIRLAAPAPTGGCDVTITSSDPATLAFPDRVTVRAGETEVNVSSPAARVAAWKSLKIGVGTARLTRSVRVLVRPARFIRLKASRPSAGSEGFTVSAFFDGRPADGTLIRYSVDNPIAKMRYVDTIEYRGEIMGTQVNNSVLAPLDPPEEDVTVTVQALGTTRSVTERLEGVHLKGIVAPRFGQKSGSNMLATIQLTSRTGREGMDIQLSATGGATVPNVLSLGYYVIERGVYVRLPVVTKPQYITLRASARGVVRTRKILVVP